MNIPYDNVEADELDAIENEVGDTLEGISQTPD